MAKKRKSLMDTLSDYQGEHGYGPKAKGAVKGKGPVRDGKTYGETLKVNKREDKGGPKGVLAPKHGGKPPTAPPPVSSGGGTGKPKSGSGGSSRTNSGGGGTPNQQPVRLKKPDKPKIGSKKVHRGTTYRYDGKDWINIGKQKEGGTNKGSAGRNARRGTASKK